MYLGKTVREGQTETEVQQQMRVEYHDTTAQEAPFILCTKIIFIPREVTRENRNTGVICGTFVESARTYKTAQPSLQYIYSCVHTTQLNVYCVMLMDCRTGCDNRVTTVCLLLHPLSIPLLILP